MGKESKPIKIVLAEDEPMIAMAYKQGLGYHGFNIIVAKDGESALSAIQEEEPDIVLLDLIMPILNGVEVLEAMRSKSGSDSVPVIVLTNLGQASDAARVYELGAKAYLVKANLSLKELVEHIYNALDIEYTYERPNPKRK